jgi:hypothetical protein
MRKASLEDKDQTLREQNYENYRKDSLYSKWTHEFLDQLNPEEQPTFRLSIGSLLDFS